MTSNLPVYDNGNVRVEATAELVPSGQAIVYRGTLRSMADGDKDVVIKVFNTGTTWSNEVTLLVDLPQHPHVMDLLAAFNTDIHQRPKPCLVTRFIAGGDLRDCLNRHRGGFVGDNAIRLIEGIGEGVKHLHSNGIVHRDLKPENVLLEERNGALWPVLIDLGLANQTAGDTSVFITSQPKGTLHWIAPEMFEGNEWSKKTDMYALGIMMWEIFTGEVPYSHIRTNGALIKHVTTEEGRPDMGRLSAEVTQEHQDLMQLLWHRDRDERPTAEEFLERLRRTSRGHLRGGSLPLDTDSSRGSEPDVDLEFLRGWSREYVTMSMT